MADLAALLRDPRTVELMINDDGSVYVEREGEGLRKLDVAVDAAAAQAFLDALLGRVENFGPKRPLGDFSALDGSRVHVLSAPLVRGALCVTVRKRPVLRPALGDLVDGGTLTEGAAQFLKFAVESRKNILIAGGTSSGKTTLLNALCGLVDPQDRILVIEDTQELSLPQPHVIYMGTRARDVNGLPDVTLRDLILNTLRMRPDRIVVGEVRGPEAGDMLQAMNIGQEGVMCTLHASSAREALQRLETLVMMAGLDLPLRAVRSNIATAADLIVFMARTADGGRRVLQIAEITGMELDNISMGDLFKAEARKGPGGTAFDLRPTGMVPRFYEQLRATGFEPPLDFFQSN